ncbi:Peptidase family M1 [Nakamurella panacisegetis]|uniref:Peptidase family M1 n=1 Tax=Nakamurella panacisegetis TaxID=1090615 RepID=A0A1H0T190_9ACTN|nr:M1 family aminopeptidase [Nakamurella panacisegetis]SDP47714.1 Peptidase family M1 [Nakamurella panacisegetis]
MRSRWRHAAAVTAVAAVLAGCTASIAGTAGLGPVVPTAALPSPTPGPAGITTPSGRPGVPSSSARAPGSTTESTVSPDGAVGSVGIGDPYYPRSGNGGYEVDHYDIDLTYDPARNALTAVTTVSATVTAGGKLGRFNLDLQPQMQVASVTVDTVAAGFTHSGAELTVTPRVGLAPGRRITVVVTYSGAPAAIGGGTAGMGDGGWYRTPSGGAVAIGEPYSGSAWYPVNEHPSDTATYRVTATVPQKWSVISNGVAQTTGLPAPSGGSKVFRWAQNEPITSYESTIYIDTFSTVTGTTADGKPIVSVFAPGDSAKDRGLAAQTAKILQVLSSHFGTYPFDAAGGIYTNQELSFALETATRPVYANWVDLDTVVHELTHQWFGDDVVIKRWADICLNECFASYGPWLWHQDVDHADLDAEWVAEMAKYAGDASFWASPLVDMGAGNEFTSVYSRGPLAIHALRKQMGEKAFAALLKGWPATFGGRAASFDDLVAYAGRLSGQNLTGFMNAWFRGTVVPPARYLHPGGIGK